MTIIRIARVSNKEQAQTFVNKIQGRTYMNFQVLVAPDGGEFQVSVQTNYTDDANEAQEMLNLVMFNLVSE